MDSRAPVSPEMLESGMEVGRKPEDRFRWLVDVAQRDLGDTPDADLNALRWQMAAFAASVRKDFAPEPGIDPLMGSRYAPMVRRLHGELVRIFSELRTSQRFTLPEPIIDGAVWAPNMYLAPVNTRSLEQRFFGGVVAVLMAVGEKLRVCENAACRGFFLSRRRKKFCGRTCAQRVRTARFRDSHRDQVRAWKHQAYVRKRRAQTGNPRLKVARRPRGNRKSDGGV